MRANHRSRRGWGYVRGNALAAPVLCALLLITEHAQCEPANTAPHSITRQPERVAAYAAALAEYEAGRETAAYRLFLELWRTQPSFDVAIALGQLELNQRRYALAAEHFTYAERTVPPTAVGSYSAAIAAGLREAKLFVTELRLRVTPPDATLRVDGEPVIISAAHPAPLFLMPGKHRFVFTRKGYVTESHELDAVASDAAVWDINLQQETAPPSPPAAKTPPTGTKPKIPAQPAPSALLAVGGGLAIVAGAVGGVFLTASETGPSDSAIGTTLMLGSLGLSLATSVTWQIWSEAVAPADAQRGYATRVWIAGQSPGEPSGAKVGVVSTLHAASLAALGLGIWRYVEYRDAATQVDAQGVPGLCGSARASAPTQCDAWIATTENADSDRRLGIALVAGAALLHLTAIAVGEWWPNVTPGGDARNIHGARELQLGTAF